MLDIHVAGATRDSFAVERASYIECGFVCSSVSLDCKVPSLPDRSVKFLDKFSYSIHTLG